MLISALSNNYHSTGVIFLPGFLSDLHEFETIAKPLANKFSTYVVDFVSDYPEETEVSYVNFLNSLSSELASLPIKHKILVGYSLGARLAVGCYLKNPSSYQGLFLESFNPGIQDASEREKRHQQDRLLSMKILEQGLEDFLITWYKNPIFALTPEQQAEVVEVKKTLNPKLMAKILDELSVGAMPSYCEELKNIKCAVALLSGELDLKFSEIAWNVQKIINKSELIVIPKAGHNTHFGQRQEYQKHLINFCSSRI